MSETAIAHGTTGRPDENVVTTSVAPDHFPLKGGELLAILAFWAFLAALAAAGRLLDPRAPGLQPAISSALVRLAVFEYGLWALLTVPILWLSSRLSVEGGRRVERVMLFLAIGIVVALLVDATVAMVRAELLPMPRPRRRGLGPGPMGGGFSLTRSLGRLGFLDDLMVYLAILAGGVARDYFLRYRLRQEETVRLQAHAAHLQAQLAEARLAVLRTQLNPHFLFNTLHAVSALVERDPRGVRRMIARLSELLRYTLDGATEQEMTLEREMELLGRYLEIMQIRFQGRLEVSMDVPDETRAALVPNLVLQPLVENAIKHGVDAAAGRGRIAIHARRDGGELVLEVRDDGPGPDGEVPSEGGLGLRNTRERLAALYGPRARLSLEPAEGGGTIARVVVPFHTQPERTAAAAEREERP